VSYLAGVRTAQGRLSEAAQGYERALRMQEEVYADQPEHPSLVTTAANLASVREAQLSCQRMREAQLSRQRLMVGAFYGDTHERIERMLAASSRAAGKRKATTHPNSPLADGGSD